MTANDSDVSDGDILTGSQVVRVYGENLTAPFVTLTFGGVEYTPLAHGEDYIEFILGNNGVAIINVDGSQFMSFEVEGIIVPEELPTIMYLYNSTIAGPSTGPNTILLAHSGSATCLHVNKPYDPEHPYYIYKIGIPNLDLNRIAYNNCGYNSTRQEGTTLTNIGITLEDIDKPAWITLDNFIIAVFNYTTE